MKKWLFIVVVAAQAFYLVAMAVSYYVMEDFGETVTLQTAPVDPSDVFYGDYVILNYEVNTIPKGQLSEGELERGDKVYVYLVPNDNGIFEVQRASLQKQNAKENEVIMTGRYEFEANDGFQIDYGIGRYYVEDNSGETYENHQGDMMVEIAIAPWGQKRIIEVMLAK
ncbi:hypothetical protein GLW08_05930 [Pontibacillus yanchengensis]|uniref:Uncharacterized protein n=2 Tax=Pontibacillus yanchengensis TaxID=462910 RepID=A0ACC7VE48_9BACI|nr:GDYXXLXY domain-containing protein [Pontibacillus yanchengensis]MYL32295.1 hypothetical protein [Pontibacillus yanchengensis]MYL52875.1 hypothetical protein [Pontibacillus yanchengensis]